MICRDKSIYQEFRTDQSPTCAGKAAFISLTITPLEAVCEDPATLVGLRTGVLTLALLAKARAEQP
jgi:hypothetical protein